MENLKIRVNSEAESKEAQELFFELGYTWSGDSKGIFDFDMPEYIVNWNNGYITVGDDFDKNRQEITLPELRDLVVLKRNDVGDASHINCDGQYMYEDSVGNWYLYHNNAWKSDGVDIDDMPKPIEKPMKEYLRKNNDGEYILEVTDEREAQEPHAKHWIEVPKGCDYLISVFGLNSFIDSDMFAKFKTKNVLWSRKPMKEYLIKSGDGKYLLTHHDSIGAVEIPEGANTLTIGIEQRVFWKDNFSWSIDGFNSKEWRENDGFDKYMENYKNSVRILWQRHTHPEELPFIDDEPSLNDQYAEIEKVRQSHRTASEIADSALKHIRERAETYDQPTGERSAAKTAKAFNAITGKDITESEVWLLLQLLKDVRQWSREDYHQDSAEDCIAYAALKAESLEGGE